LKLLHFLGSVLTIFVTVFQLFILVGIVVQWRNLIKANSFTSTLLP